MKKFLVSAVCLLSLSTSYGATYKLKEVVSIKPQPNAKVLEVWIPVPYENEWQKIRDITVKSPLPFTLQKENEYGNMFVYIRKESGLNEPVKVTVEAVIERKQVTPQKYRNFVPLRYYLSDNLVPVKEFKRMADAIVKGKNRQTEKLRAIYDYVVSHMKYDKSGRGWGRGDAIWACDAKRGNCTDFHSLLIALSRAAGIPALFEIGIPVNGNGKVKGYHCWVLAFPEGYVYGIDASEAAKHPEKREYFFGHLCDRRIGITRGRDILLTPPQHGSRLNFIYKAYEEVDNQPTDGTLTEFFVEKLSD